LHTRMAVSMMLVVLALVPPARGDTLYPDGALVRRTWCVHLTATGFIADDSTGDRVFSPTVGLGASFLRFGALRLPVLQVQLSEADQTVERFLGRSTVLGSVGFSLRIAEYDDGKFESQLHVAYSLDLSNTKRRGVSIGLGLGF
jgi:hypothetical protein